MTNPTLVATAVEYHAAGLTPLPVAPDGSKRPLVDTWTEWQDTQPDLNRAVSWFATVDTDGIGILTGGPSHREVMEFEGRAIREGLLERFTEACEKAGLGELWARVRAGYVAASPSTGQHNHIVVIDGPCLRNTKLAQRPSTPDELEAWKVGERAKLDTIDDPQQRAKRAHNIDTTTADQVRQVLIETRGQGGFIVCAPSNGRTHPSGLPWQSIVGKPGDAARVTVAERDALYAVARSLDQMPSRAAKPNQAEPTAFTAAGTPGTRPGDDYNARATWEEILIPHGWQVAARRGRETHWTRPGKDLRDGISATTGHAGDADRLFVFSSSTEFQPEVPYSKFAAYTLLEHGGDYAAAARALAPDRNTRRNQLDWVEPSPRIDPDTGEITDDGDDQGDTITIEAAVFGATPILTHIEQAAQSRLVVPWAVLGSVLARILAEVPPHVVLPPIIGSDASLNLAFALVANSGGGKSGAMGCAADVVPIPGRLAQDIGPGSGEGLIMQFLERDPDTKDNVVKMHPMALLIADEIAQIGIVQGRASQATFGPIIRTMLTGGGVSTTAVDRERRRKLPANRYRLCAVAGVQPALSDVLLSDTDAGTPQRWVWLPADDPEWSANDVPWPGAIRWTMPQPPRGDIDGFVRLTIPDQAREAIIEARKRSLRREGDPLDGHRLLTREKVAAALALLHGEFAVTDQWWQLAGLIMHKSDATRAHCSATLSTKAESEHRARGRLDAVREAGAREARTDEAMKAAAAVWRVVASTARHPNAKHEPGEGCTLRCITHALRHRKGVDRGSVVDVAVDLAWIEERDGRYYAGPAQPAEGGEDS